MNDLRKMTDEEILSAMDELRDEIDRRIQVLAEARDGRSKGPGRPPKNGVVRLKPADLEPADTDS